MISRKRTLKQEKLARIYDDEILPVWSRRFGRMVLRDLDLPDRCQVLDLAAATGYPAVDIIRRLGPGSRFIAIDSSSALLDVARTKVEEMGAKGVFFRSELPGTRLPFADDVYDLVVSNLGLTELDEPAAALADYARVTVPGGEVRATIPLEGTFQEFHDIYREVLTKHDRNDTLARLDEHIAVSYPTVADCEGWLRAAGLGRGHVEVDRFTMLFRSSREFFFAPVIEFGPLSAWKDIAGAGQEMQDIFWYIKEAIDAYFEGRAFAATVVAGCLVGRKPLSPEDETTFDTGRPDIDPIPLGPDTLDTPLPGGSRGPRRPDTDEDVELDAFIEGKPRPDHLDE